jgi:hypothetical protein
MYLFSLFEISDINLCFIKSSDGMPANHGLLNSSTCYNYGLLNSPTYYKFSQIRFREKGGELNNGVSGKFCTLI